MPAMIFWYQVLAGMTLIRDSSTRNFLNNKASPFVDIIEDKASDGPGSGSDMFVFTSKDGSTRNSLGEQGAPGGDVIQDYTAGEDRIVFAGMEGITYTGRVFEKIQNNDPLAFGAHGTLGPTVDAIDADPDFQNEIVFIKIRNLVLVSCM